MRKLTKYSNNTQHQEEWWHHEQQTIPTRVLLVHAQLPGIGEGGGYEIATRRWPIYKLIYEIVSLASYCWSTVLLFFWKSSKQLGKFRAAYLGVNLKVICWASKTIFSSVAIRLIVYAGQLTIISLMRTALLFNELSQISRPKLGLGPWLLTV